jgi:hypothetical protein
VADHLEPVVRSEALESVSDALSVELLVVEDEDLGGAELLLEVLRRDLALVVVGGDDPDVVAVPARVILVGLARLGSRRLVRQAGVRVRGRDHRDRDLVDDRDDDCRATGVVRADHADEVLGVRVGSRVLRTLRLVPLPRGGRCVVESLELDVVRAGLVVRLLEHELDRLVHLRRLDAIAALQRQVGDDLHRLPFRAPAAASGGVRAAFVVVPAAAARSCEGDYGEQEREEPERSACLQMSSSGRCFCPMRKAGRPAPHRLLRREYQCGGGCLQAGTR